MLCIVQRLSLQSVNYWRFHCRTLLGRTTYIGMKICYCSTKQVTRFHPQYVLEDVQLLAQHSEQLVANAKQAWSEFLRYI